MNFRIQEILKTLIPGLWALALATTFSYRYLDFSFIKAEVKDAASIYLIFLLTTAYVVGYFLDWLGSLFERIYYKRVPPPSFFLINGTTKRITLSNDEEIFKFLCNDLNVTFTRPLARTNTSILFKRANVLKEKNKTVQMIDKINNYYFLKIFSRNLAVSFLFAFVLYITIYFGHLNHITSFNWFSFLSLLFFGFTILRWREHAFYYSRQVIYAAYSE
ncbi:MAG: hypothetical protein QHC79_17670 [Pseudosphingobacterium sp.]|nr:hypothetical protein [Pseudosphingobacterium sp.]